MTRKTGNKWSTVQCGGCDLPHSCYSGKLDSNGVEYIICGSTNKRIDMPIGNLEADSHKIKNYMYGITT